MAIDVLLEINGMEGESLKKAGAIEVLAWSWGMSNSGSFHSGGGGGSGQVNIQDLSVTKWVDKASCPLMIACSTGQHIADATISIQKSTGDVQTKPYMTIKMTKVMCTSVSTGGSGGEDRFTENVTLNFAAVEIEYLAQDAKGVLKKAGGYKYDIAAGKKL